MQQRDNDVIIIMQPLTSDVWQRGRRYLSAASRLLWASEYFCKCPIDLKQNEEAFKIADNKMSKKRIVGQIRRQVTLMAVRTAVLA